jgi:diguanylate cyclase (GGDEF)-like protein
MGSDRYSEGPAEDDGRRPLFEMAFDALPDGVLLVDERQRAVYANPAFAELWRIPPELLMVKSDRAFLGFVFDQLFDSRAFEAEVSRLRTSTDNFQDEIRLKDGRIMSRRSAPLKRTSENSARVWLFTDITKEKHAEQDPLTELPNRRAYMRDFPEFVEAPDDGLVRGSAIMDVDNFKKYNDLYGHDAGDQTLRQIGKLLRAELHEADDLVFRIGGEEFLIAVRSREVAGVLWTFERIRRQILALGIPHIGNAPHNFVSVSLGVGTFQGKLETRSLFEAVDRALYQAKHAGRNRLHHVRL